MYSLMRICQEDKFTHDSLIYPVKIVTEKCDIRHTLSEEAANRARHLLFGLVSLNYDREFPYCLLIRLII
jgi:hypothetical protein